MTQLRHSSNDPHQTSHETLNSKRVNLTQRIDRFVKLEKLGEGNYGSVYKAKDTIDGNSIVALKRIKLDDDDDGVPSTAIREISLLNDLNLNKISLSKLNGINNQNGFDSKPTNLNSNSNYVIGLKDVVFNSDKQLYLSFEFLDKDLRRYMDCVGLLPIQLVKYIMWQICKGMELTHSKRILHRDMKPQNVLIDRRGNVKIGDWGLARTTAAQMKTITHEVATLWYRAPEILMGTRTYSEAVDMWAVGCILAELSSDDPLFAGDSEIATLFLMFQLLGTPNSDVWPSIESLPDYKSTFPKWKGLSGESFHLKFNKLDDYGIDLLKRLLNFDPSKRLTAKQCLTHPYFDDLNIQEAIEQAIDLGKLLDTNDGQARRMRRHARQAQNH